MNRPEPIDDLARSTGEHLDRATLNSIAEGVIRTDARGIIGYLNAAAARLTGWALEEALEQPVEEVFQLVDEQTGYPLACPIQRCLERGELCRSETRAMLVRRGGSELPVRVWAAPVHHPDDQLAGVVVTFGDISELRHMERGMRYLASHDPLTGLLNRHQFDTRLGRALTATRDEGRPHTLLYLDLDGFKVVNDSCGHLAGDQLLQELAALLGETTPEAGSLARIGGDEFAILLADHDAEGSRSLAESVRQLVEGYRFEWGERTFQVGVSIGIATVEPDSSGPMEVMSAADAACSAAKQRGRNRIHVYEADDTMIGERRGEVLWVTRIREALEKSRFRLYAQPIRPLGEAHRDTPLCEIFLRMLDPKGRVVEPSAFIGAAERHQLITGMDRWVVSTAFASIALRIARERAGPRPVFTVNVSGQSLGDEDFLEFVEAQLESSGVDPGRLGFEITETAAIGHMTQARRFFTMLRRRGMRFVLDDFGSGLASFAYLRNLPVDLLKIDASFIQSLADDPINREIVRAARRIGALASLPTIAEGVEDEATLEALVELGVDYAQGYWIDRPEPFEPDATGMGSAQ